MCCSRAGVEASVEAVCTDACEAVTLLRVVKDLHLKKSERACGVSCPTSSQPLEIEQQSLQKKLCCETQIELSQSRLFSFLSYARNKNVERLVSPQVKWICGYCSVN